MTYHDGDRVILPADPGEGIVEERGTVEGEGDDGVYIVRVDKPLDRHDDRLREVHADQMRPETPTQITRKRRRADQ